MVKVVWTEPALGDLRDVLQYAFEQSPAYAVSLGESLLAWADRLESQPFCGWKVHEYDDPAVRELFVRPYRMLYQVKGDACRIVGVIHASRDMIEALNERLP